MSLRTEFMGRFIPQIILSSGLLPALLSLIFSHLLILILGDLVALASVRMDTKFHVSLYSLKIIHPQVKIGPCRGCSSRVEDGINKASLALLN